MDQKNNFSKNELRVATIAKYEGISNGRRVCSFVTYKLCYEENGTLINIFNNKEKYITPDKSKLNKEESYLMNSSPADFVLYRAHDIYNKDIYDIEDLEDAVLATDVLYFEDKDMIIAKRQESNIKNRIGKILKKMRR